MHTVEYWEHARQQLLLDGEEVHRYFNIGRKVGEYATLDYFQVSTGKRLLSYPSFLAEGPQPVHPSLVPLALVSDGKTNGNGIDTREVPSGTMPLLRIADSFDTPGSGASRRPDIFYRAGVYIRRLWELNEHHLPEDLSLSMLNYIPQGIGAVSVTPPVKFVPTAHPGDIIDRVADEMRHKSFGNDINVLIDQFIAGSIKPIRGTVG